MDNPPPVAILAGGLATRLGELVKKIPKSLVPVAGQPFLTHQLNILAEHGLRDVVLCVGHLGEQIEQLYGDGAKWGVRLRYAYDGTELRGTGGALRRVLPLLGEEFLVLYGDVYLDIDYAAVVEAFRASGKPAMMTVIFNVGGRERSNVWFEDGMVRAYEKRQPNPNLRYIDYGLSAYRAEALANTKENDLSEIQKALAADGKLAGFEMTLPYQEIGSHDGLRLCEDYLRRKAG
jgi:NDP-sugar pyrophosphorylase family protein